MSESYSLSHLRSEIGSWFALSSTRAIIHGSLVALLLAAFTQYLSSSSADVCTSQSSPNPIAQQFPNFATGNLNGTSIIIPIPLEKARDIIPDGYNIREDLYRSLLPSFPAGMYPMVAMAVHDHDVQFAAYNMTLPDFSRAALEFPFIDIFGDNSSSFRWAATMMISATNEVATKGAEGCGITVHPSTFNPSCNAYKTLPDGSTYFHAGMYNQNSSISRFMTVKAAVSKMAPYPMRFIKNITNQVTFANPTLCDNYLRHYDTPLTTGAFAPVPVQAIVSAKVEPFVAKPQTWTGYGWRFATAFTEPPMQESCEKFRGMQ